MDDRKGILDNFLAPLGQSIVDPNGNTTNLLNGRPVVDAQAAEAARLAELKRQQELAKEKSLMEAAASASDEPLSRFNPFVMLFGQPGDVNSTGLLGK